MSFPVNSTDSNPRRPPLPKTRRIIALPISERNRKVKRRQKAEIASLPRFRTDLLSARYFCCILCCYFGWCRPARHCGVVVGDTAPELRTGLCDTLTLKTAVRFNVNRITRKPWAANCSWFMPIPCLRWHKTHVQRTKERLGTGENT